MGIIYIYNMYKTFNVITYALNFIGDIIYIIMYRGWGYC